MINIITGGCSFTHDPDSWANILKNKLSNDYTITNIAEGGVGQEYIVRCTIDKLEKTQGPKICMVQFSGWTRLELIVDLKENRGRFEKLKNDKRHAGTDPSRLWYDSKEIILLRTTDWGHNWFEFGSYAGKLVDKINTIISFDQRLMWSYEHIARLQWYCKINNIPLFCFYGWQDCKEKGKNVSLVNRSRRLVDWNNFWFHGEQGGMAEWMLDHGHHGKLEEDKTNTPPTGIGFDPVLDRSMMVGHPTPEAHNHFCDEIIMPWIKQND